MSKLLRGIYCIECGSMYGINTYKQHIKDNPNHHFMHAEYGDHDTNIDGKMVARESTYKQKVAKFIKDSGNHEFFKKIIQHNRKVADEWGNGDKLVEGQHLTQLLSKLFSISEAELIDRIDAIDIQLPTPESELDHEKNLSKQLIDAERELRKFANVYYNGMYFEVSEWDIMMLMSLLSFALRGNELPLDDYWRTANNTNIRLSSSDLENLDDIIRTQVQNAYLWSWVKKAEIDACKTLEELKQVDLELTHVSPLSS